MLTTIRQRLNREEGGFTLIELLVVLIIIGVLLAIAVPAYLGFKDRAEKRAAQSDVRAAVPAVEAYYQDATTDVPAGGGSSYTGMDVADLQARDAAVKLNQVNASASTYCIERVVGKWTAWKDGPAADIQVAETGANVGCP